MEPLEGSRKRRYQRSSRTTLYRRRKEREDRQEGTLDSSDSSDFDVKPPRKKKVLVQHDEYDSSFSSTADAHFDPDDRSPRWSDPPLFNQLLEDPAMEYNSFISGNLDDSRGKCLTDNTTDKFDPESFSPHSSDSSVFDVVFREPAMEPGDSGSTVERNEGSLLHNVEPSSPFSDNDQVPAPVDVHSDDIQVTECTGKEVPSDVLEERLRFATSTTDSEVFTSHLSWDDSGSDTSHSASSETSSAIDSTSSSTESEADDISSECGSFEAHYLDEEPRNQQQDIIPNGVIPDDNDPDDPGGGDDDDPDDPGGGDDDDPDDPGGGDDDDDDDDDDDLFPEVANLANEDVNVPVELRNDVTKGEIILMELACHIRHHDTFLRALDTFKNMNVWLGPRNLPRGRARQNFLPASKAALWSFIQLDTAGIQRHVYCSRAECGQYIGRKTVLGQFAQCQCGFRIETAKAKFFVTLNVINQIRYLLNIPGIWEKLQYRETRRKMSPTSIEDVYDGMEYKRLQREGGILSNPYNLSYCFNFDGVKLSNKGTLKMTPLFLRINELPPDMRQKFHLLAAVHVDVVDPNPQAFLKPFVRQANRLSNEGINWKPDAINEVNSKVIPMAHGVDSPVRCSMLNMAKWDSAYGCTYCTSKGIRMAGSQRYPFVNMEGIPPFEERNHAGMVANMIQAQENHNNPHVIQQPGDVNNPNSVRGHKGTTQMLLLDHHDLREGQGVDDLHQDHEGTAKYLTELLLTVARRVDARMPTVVLLQTIDARLLSIKTPSRISRKPRTIHKRTNWNGTEWRNWFFYYGIPCMNGLIDPEYLDVFASISHGCYLLSQDVIEPADIESAERLFAEAGRSFERLFGRERIRFNLHITLSHKVNSVQKLGPPWCYSTYNFESLNMKLRTMVTSPKGAPVQIVTRTLLNLTVNAAVFDERYSEEVRLRLEVLLNKQRLHRTLQVAPHIYLLGNGQDGDLSNEEREVLTREGFIERHVQIFKGFLIRDTRYISLPNLNPEIKSDDSFMYTFQDTFCTIRKIILFEDDNGEQHFGAFVNEHDVDHVLPLARHITVLRNAAADLLHFINLTQVRTPAIKMNVENQVHAVCVPNCFEID